MNLERYFPLIGFIVVAQPAAAALVSFEASIDLFFTTASNAYPSVDIDSSNVAHFSISYESDTAPDTSTMSDAATH